MKKITSLFILIIVACLYTTTQLIAQSDGAVYASEEVAELNLGSDYELPSSIYNYVENGNGNYTINAIWFLSEENMFIPDKGVNKIVLSCYLNFDGGSGDPFIGVLSMDAEEGEELQVEGEASINKHGKCHAVFHINCN